MLKNRIRSSVKAPTCSSVADYDLLGLRVRLAAGVSNWQVGLHELGEEVDVADGESQRVHLGEPLLVRQRGDVRAQPLERVIDGLHPPPLPDVGRLPQLLHLHVGAHPSPALQQRPAAVAHLGRQVRGAVGAAVREGGRGGGREGQVADVVVRIVRRRSAPPVFAVIVLEVAREKVDVVIQKVISVQWSVSRGVVGEEVVIVEVRRGRERVEGREGVQHAVHLTIARCLLTFQLCALCYFVAVDT